VVEGYLARDEGGGDAQGDPLEWSPCLRGQSRKHTVSLAGYAGDEMTDEDREWARRTAAGLPPLTDGQRDILTLLLSKRR
jgi:hypothetical protein